MKKKSPDQRDWHEVRIETLREKEREAPQPSPTRAGAPENAGSSPTSTRSEEKPRGVGLVNEPRPGVGTRSSAGKADAKPTRTKRTQGADTKGKPQATKHAYEEPRPAPREQAPDSLAHEQERQTGMSGQSSGT